MLGHQETSEEALGASESATTAATSTMAPGAPSREENRLARVGDTCPYARENAPEGAQGQEPLPGEQQLPPRPGEAAQETGMDAFGSKYNIADVLGPEEEPPDAENIEEDGRSPAGTERCYGRRKRSWYPE